MRLTPHHAGTIAPISPLLAAGTVLGEMRIRIASRPRQHPIVLATDFDPLYNTAMAYRRIRADLHRLIVTSRSLIFEWKTRR